jgi:TRAP-type C4-dicarboxylate transport system permease small subunit
MVVAEPSFKLYLVYFVAVPIHVPGEGSMTSTKIMYVIAAVVPFGFVALAAFALIHAYRQRQQREAAQRVVVRAAVA